MIQTAELILALDTEHELCGYVLTRIIHDPLRLVDFLPPFCAEQNC